MRYRIFDEAGKSWLADKKRTKKQLLEWQRSFNKYNKQKKIICIMDEPEKKKATKKNAFSIPRFEASKAMFKVKKLKDFSGVCLAL